MNWRTTAVLFLILVALGGYLYYDSQQEPDATDDAAPIPTVAAPAVNQNVPLLSGAITNDVRQIDVGRAEDGAVATFTHDGLGDWQQTMPEARPVLTTTLTTQVTGFINLTSSRVLSSSENPLSAYGLDAPAYNIELTTLTEGETRQFRLVVGNETPTSDSYYVQKAGDPRVYVVAKGAVDNMINLIDNPPLPEESS